MIEIEIKDQGLQSAVSRLVKRTSNLNPIKQGIQAEMFADVFDHFEKETGPQGKWKSLSQITIRKRRKNTARILQDTGYLRNSIIGKNSNSIAKINMDKISIGSNLPYAAIHNQGGLAGRNKKVHIPKREYLYLSDNGIKNITKMVEEYLVS